MFCHRSIPAGMAIQNRLDVWTNPGDAWSLLRVSHIFHLVILMIIIFYTYQWYSIFDRIYITVWYYTYQCPFGNVKKHTVGVVHRSIRVACLFSFFLWKVFFMPTGNPIPGMISLHRSTATRTWKGCVDVGEGRDGAHYDPIMKHHNETSPLPHCNPTNVPPKTMSNSESISQEISSKVGGY